MGGGGKGLGRGEKRERDAVEWVVENGSDHSVDEVTVAQWEEWDTQPGNQADYAEVIEMCQQIRRLPAPSLASREELVRDALAESDGD